MQRKTRFPVEGMTCGGCASRVSEALSKISGVSEAHVNFATGDAFVVFADEEVGEARLHEEVLSLGYQIPKADEDPVAETPSSLPLIVGAIGSSIVVVLSMVPAFESTGSAWACLVLSFVVVAVAGFSFHRKAFLGLRRGSTSMETLVSLGSSVALLWSAFVVVSGRVGLEPLYFDSAVVIVTLVLLGKRLEGGARRGAGDALRALGRLDVSSVQLEDGERIPLDKLEAGMHFRVTPGERIASDGQVVEGQSEVDTSLVTGEPLPRPVEVGDEVLGGTLNGEGALVVEATRVGAESALGQIRRLVREAQAGQAPVQHLVDRIASIFVPTVLLLAVGTLAAWLLSGAALGAAIRPAVAVLVVACPCALGLATPMAILVGTAVGARLGIILRGAEVLERSRGLDRVIFDKTGTLTEGQPRVVGVRPLDPWTEPELLHLAGALEKNSEHPIARAITAAAGSLEPAPKVDGFRGLPGRGASASVDGEPRVIGRRELFKTIAPALESAASDIEGRGQLPVYIGSPTEVFGILALDDSPRPEAQEAVDACRELGLSVSLLSGDLPSRTETLARGLGIEDFRGGCLPGDKAAEVERHEKAGERVAMVGDGINDAPALVAASVGIAIGSGADVAVESSDLSLVGGDPRGVADAIALSRRCLGTIRGNLFWAFAYNVAAIPLAASGTLAPMVAATAMAASSLFVVGNSLRLRRFRGVTKRVIRSSD